MTNNREGSKRATEFEFRDNDIYVRHTEMESSSDQHVNMNKCCYSCPSKRYAIALLGFAGFFITSGIRSNFGVTLVHLHSNNSSEGPELDWTPETVMIIDRSFYWSYLVAQIPGGWLATRFSATRMFGGAVAGSSLLNLLLIFTFRLHPGYVLFNRIFQGLFEGPMFPACFGVWRHWAPPMERTRLATLAFAGFYAGALVGMPVSGWLAQNYGWQSSLFFYGLLGLAWWAMWEWKLAEKPSLLSTISSRELNYIESSLGDESMVSVTKIPFGAMFRSMPFYALIVGSFCHWWTFYLLAMGQRAYFHQVFDIRLYPGVITMVPFFGLTFLVPISGLLADCLQSRLLSTTLTRKVFNCSGAALQAICFLILAFTNSEKYALLACTFALLSTSFSISGFYVNHLDLAPRYVSIISGITNFVNILVCLFILKMFEFIPTDEAMTRWQNIFFVSIAIQVVGGIFYAIFAKSEEEQWAKASLPYESNQPLRPFNAEDSRP